MDAEITVVEQRLGELQELRSLRLQEAADAQAALEESQGKLAQLVAVRVGDVAGRRRA